MKRTLQLLVAGLLVWVLLRIADLDALAEALRNFRPWSVAVAVALFLLANAVAASKWRLLWDRASWLQMLLANFAGQFYSLVLPGQVAGEVVKTLRMGRQFADTAGVASSVLIDRVTGLVALLSMAAVGALCSSDAAGRLVAWPLMLALLVFAFSLYAIGLPGLLRVISARLRRWGETREWLAGPAQRLLDFLGHWSALLARPRVVFAAVGLGFVFQALALAINVLLASDLGIHLSLFDWCWVFGAVSVAVLLPLTLAGVGVREGAYAGALGLLGVPIEKAIALSLAVFAITLTGALIGALVELRAALRSRSRR